MGCVNKASKEFKDLAARHNLDSNALELIVHKYWLQTGNETLFPTDVYIQAQLGNISYKESGKSVRKLWDLRYSAPQEYYNMQDLQKAKAEALQYFPTEAVISYKNAKGNYVLSVKRPVERINKEKADYFKKADNSEDTKDVKILKLNIKENQTYGIGKVRELYNKFNTDKTSQDLANKVFDLADRLNIQVSFNKTLPEGILGRYTNNNTITYKKSFFEKDMSNSEKAPILLHEVLHAISMYALSDTTENWQTNKDLKKFRTEINSIYQDLKDNPLLEKQRGIKDVFEFVAELANPVFRAKLQEIDRQIKENKKAQKKSFWQRILDAFKSLLGLHVTNSYYQRSMNALDMALNAFDIDTYMKYNGVKNIFRELHDELGDSINSMSDEELKAKAAAYFDKKVYDEELQSIKKKAIADGTFMKAPNGRATNLTERQWLQVRSKSFKEWFGDWENDPKNASKVVDENGEPLVVYHGGEANITTFLNMDENPDYESTKHQGYAAKDRVGIYYSKYNSVGENYAKPYKERGHIYNVFLNIRNPKRVSYTTTLKNRLIKIGSLGLIEKPDVALIRRKELDTLYKGNDGIIHSNGLEYVIFNSNQVKSATDNVGTFYTDHDDIYNYEIDNSNVNDLLSDNEKKDILRAIRTINEAKRSLIDTGGDFLYIVDHTDKDGLKHLKNGQKGFLVKEAIDIRGLNKEQINDIKNWCNEEGLRGALQDLNRVLERHGYRDSIYNSDSIDAKDKTTNNDNAGLGKQTLEGKTRRGQSTQNSQDDFQGGQIKTGYDGTNHPRYMDVNTARDFINSMSGKDLRDELNLVNQESADYDLVNGVEEKPKHSGKAVPQDFTFNDGTTVKAPFRPNAQQVDALNAMSDFIKSDETSMTLSGYAGTGKTSLMEMIAKKCRANYKNVVFCASTNKAAAVLNDKVKKAGFEAKTLNKIFGIQVEIDPDSKEYDARKTRNKINEDALLKQGIYSGTTVIIDEASMINEENYNTINMMAKDFGLKIIYVGDSAQLAPVKEKDISKVFRNGDGKVITLTQVERTDDNAILKEATDLRNGKPLSGESSFNAKGEGVAYVSPQNRESINSILSHYAKELKNNPNAFRVLAYTNAAVAKYNQQIRHLLGYDTQIPQKGEPMTGYNNWGYVWSPKGGSYRFINSEAYKVVKNDKPKVVYKRLGDGRVVAMEAIPVTLEDSLGKVDTFDFMDVKTNPQNRQAATILANEKKALWAKWRTTPGKKAKTAILKEINDIDDFLFINDNIEDDKGHLLQSKVIDFGYAMTVHKSQGSTFTNVLIDDVDIQKGALQQNNNDNVANAWEAVDIGNNEERDGSNAEMIDSEEVDLFGSTPTETTASTPTPTAPKQGNNLVQQLEYVAVSRATDTVTVISNNIKKEGSPLHSEATQSSKTDEHKTPVNPKVSTINSTPRRSDNEITKQVVDHLKNIPGIKVLGRNAMAEFLKTHNPKYLQQYIAKNSLPKGELSVLSSALMTKYGNNTSYGDVIQTANYEYTVNYKGAGEFDIIEYHQIDNNLNNKYNDREREGFPESLDRLSTRDEIAKSKYNSDSFHVENREANGDNVGLDKQASQGKSNQTSSDASSRQHQEWSEIKRNSTTGRITFVDNDGRTVSSTEDWKDIETFTTSQGEVYGFVDKDGNIYLDETKISPEHPIHEYTHLWDRTVQKHNPKLWNRGIELMKQTPLWNEVLNDEHYGKQWQSMNLSKERLENLIASEVHARIVGENGEKLLGNLAKRKGQGGIISKLKQWILDMWKDIKSTFGSWSQEDLDSLTLKDFNHMTVRDFVEGTNLKDAANASYTEQQSYNNNTETEEGNTQMVELPGYELSKGLPNAVPVDAEWKISYLKELDAQLSIRKSKEEVNNILNQMDTILQSPSEKEYLEDLKHSKEDKTEKQLSEYDKLNKQIDNLLDGRVMYEGEEVTSISASEVRHVAQLVADEISDFITELQQDGSKANEWFPTFTGYSDFSKVSRKDIVAAVGINNLIQRAKDFMNTEKHPIDDMDASLQADLIFDNWDAIMYLAADVFAFNEGFGITKDYTKGNFTTTEDTSNVDYDNFNDYSNDPDAMAEGEKDEQEHWQIESRTIDVLNSMSALVRQGLHQCFLLDENNEKVKSVWGLPERVNPRKVTNSILRWCQGAQSLEDMIAKMSDKQAKNPWLSQLIDRLSDKSGNETDFQSQFYSVFTKDFTNYSIVKLENGRYYSMPVNSHPALSEAMNTITTQYKIGQLPLFGIDGKIRKDILGTENTVGKNYAFNFHKALVELQSIDKALKEGSALDEAMAKKATANVAAVCKNFGYYVTEDMVSDIMNAENISKFAEYMRYLVDSLDKAVVSKEEYDPFKFHGKNSIDGTLRNFLTPITDVLEDTAVNAFYDSGKMYQSYVTPSYLSRLFKKFKTLSGQQFEDFIMNEYGSSGFFKDEKFSYDSKKGWKNSWLQALATDENARKVFDHKVELNFNKHNYMRNMTDAEYTVSLITEYFSTNQENTAWFRIPMMSNKPSSEFIKFYTYRNDTYKDDVTSGLHDIFLQEVSRIQTVRRRNYSKSDSEFIQNFDTNGRKFCFLPVLNAYLNNSAFDISHRDVLKNEDGSVSSDNARFAALLQKFVTGETELTSEESTELNNLVDKVLKQSTEDRVQSILEKWEKAGILAAAKNIKDIYNSELDTSKLIKDEDRDNIIMKEVRKQVENYLWNDTLASKNILELMVSDIAFYKDTEDLQKRLAQLHAPGLRGRKDAIDYDGKRVSDGNYRTVVLKDFDNFISNIVANINEVFDRRIAAAKDKKQEQVLISLKDSLTRPRTYNPDGSVKDKGGKYWNINVADAQGFSSPASYRKKAFIFGRWSKDAEALYQKIVDGKANYTDFETAFQPLKPFVYGKLTKNMGVDNAPIHSMQVPFQAKNSEYLLIMADAILKGEELSRPNLLRAVYRVMEDSEKLMPTKGIDTIQFESAIKSGLQGAMDISQFIDTPGGEEAAYTFMKNQIFKEEYDNNTKERVYRNYDTDTFVHELSYDNYCLQQEIPEHFKNHSQAHGSQIRMITPSDLDYYTTDEKGNQVENYYEWTEPTGKYDSDGKPIYTKKRMNADEVRKEYENTIAESIKESIDVLTAELHLDSKNPKERNLAISKILQREIMSSPRYGIDLIQACSIDKETGEFRIPKGDPIQAKRIEQLLNSIIKNRINKQKIAGGPIVQVSNFGTSKQLHIRFNDKQGNLIPLEEEYDSAEHNNMSYKEYLKKNQGGIAYFEVYAPMWDNKLFDMFSNPDGTINIDAIEATDPELLKMVSYRIPTEDKYSCAPMKVVGFMPKEAGDAIMLPYELTEIDDSDFDIDKRYVMRKEIPIKKRKRKEISKKLFDIISESYKAAHGGKTNNKWIGEQINMFLDNPQKMRNNDKFMQWMYNQYQKVAFYIDVPTSGKLYRDNKIVDMTFGILTNEMTADKILNPGGFDAPKKMGYMVAAYKNPENKYSWEELQSMSIDDLKDLSYTEKDITFADVQVQFYKQNAAAASLIGVFAVNKVAHATLEGNDIWLDVANICGDNPFNIAGHYEVNPKTGGKELVGGRTFGNRMQIDTKFDIEGNLIGKTLGSLVSASADAVKDPILNLMNINMTTAGMLNTMLRLGMTFNDAALFLSQNVIERMLNQFNKENLDNYVSLDSIIDKWITAYQEKEGLDDSSSINKEPLTKEELIEGLTTKEHSKTDYKVLLAFQKMKALTDAMRKPTFITRFNSISSAVGPLIIDNLIMEHKLESFTQSDEKELKTDFYTGTGEMIDAKTIYKNHPILEQFSRAIGIANRVFSDMPSGSPAFRECLNKLPENISDILYRDKKLLDQFANFYQSYLLIQSGVVDEKELKDTVEKFPEEFIKKDYKKKYPNNALIQAIRMNILKKTGKPYLQINITGMDEQQKEELRAAWVDLHKVNPELSKKLFDYSFFKAGVGFSPKTFMALVPTYVKEKIVGKNNASYIDTYRYFPEVVKDLVVEQFILNNLDNNKIAPWKGGKDTHYSIDLKKGTLRVYDQKDINDLRGISYMKTKAKNSTYCWKYKGKLESGDLVYELVKPLGNNKEYLEMSTSTITTPLSEIKEVTENDNQSPISESSPAETDMGSMTPSTISNLEKAKKIEEIVGLIMKQVPRYSKQEATEVFERIKNEPNKKRSAKFLQNVFKQKGLDLDIDGVIDEFNKYC